MTTATPTRDELRGFIVKAIVDLQDDGPGVLDEIRERWPQLSRGEIADAFIEAAEGLRRGDYNNVVFADGKSLPDTVEDFAWDLLSRDPPPEEAEDPSDPCPY